MNERARSRRNRVFRWAYLTVIALVGLGIAVYAGMSVLSGSGTDSLFSNAWFWFFVILFFFLLFELLPWRLGFVARGGWLGQLPPRDLSDGVKEVLRQRYVQGEIGKDQYDQMMRDLE